MASNDEDEFVEDEEAMEEDEDVVIPDIPRLELPGKRKTRKRKEKPVEILDKYGLNLKQELFCQYYTSPGEFFGNGFNSYCESYDFHPVSKYEFQVARVRASQLLSNPNVIKRINALLEDVGFNDTNVDKQLFFLISQFADYPSKLGAIKEYNKLKSRIVSKLEHVVQIPVTTINILPPIKPGELPPKEDTKGLPAGTMIIEQEINGDLEEKED